MSAVRDVMGLWLMYLVVLGAFAVAGVALFWIGSRYGQGRPGRCCWCGSAETMALPIQREPGR